MRRWLFHLSTAVSLLLLVGACVLWRHSADRSMQVQWGDSLATKYGWRLYAHAISCSRGWVYYVWTTPQILPSAGRVTRFEILGILYQSGAGQLIPGAPIAADRTTVGVAFGWLIAFTAILPMCWVWITLRQRRRWRNGLCPTCGYDLRATPQRCPECGSVPKIAAANAKSG